MFISRCYADTCPTSSEVMCLPYEDVKQLFSEYRAHCHTNLIHSSAVAGEQTFRKAFKSFDNIRLIGCKGSFQTCDICNNANDMLKSKRYNNEQRKIVLQFKRLHLLQQAEERRHQEFNRMEASSFCICVNKLNINTTKL